MIKRTKILILIFLFFISTTGLPVFYHYCEMMGESSLDKCEMCMSEIEIIEPSCCGEETMEYPVNVSSENPICCQDEFIYSKVEDEFIYNKSDVNFFASSDNLIQPIFLYPPSVDFQKEESFYCDSSPPFLIDPEIHITNSVLLI